MRAKTVMVGLCLVVSLGCSKFKKDGADGGEGSGGLSLFDKPFEGQIDLLFTDTKEHKPPVPIQYEVKQPKMRFDLPPSVGADNPMVGKSVWALLDVPGKKAYAVLDEPKKAIVFDFGKMGDDFKKAKPGGHGSSASSSAGGPADPPPKIEKTGKMDKVAGYDCEIWKITEDKPKEKKKEEIELCMAKDITWLDLHLLGIGTVDPKLAVMMELGDLNHFPLRFIAKENGAETARMEATKVEKKTLDDARLAVPAGYQVLTLDQMIASFMPPGMGSGHPMPGIPPHRPPHQ